MAADGGDSHSWGATSPSEQPEQQEELVVPDTPPQPQQQQFLTPTGPAGTVVDITSNGGGQHADEFGDVLNVAAREQALRQAGYARRPPPRPEQETEVEGQGIDSFTGLPMGMLPFGSEGGTSQHQQHLRGLATRASRESGSHTTEMMSLSAFTPYQQPGSPGDAEQYREEGPSTGAGTTRPPGGWHHPTRST
jgi:hypothetical protein